jgi:hypothetical protein
VSDALLIESLRAEIDKLKENELALRGIIEHLKLRKGHYKGITQRAGIVLNAALLLDESYIRREVLADALAGDNPETFKPRRDQF